MKDSETAWCGLSDAMKSVVEGMRVVEKVEHFPSRTAARQRETYPMRKAA